jgi:hypothetical protein
MKTDFELRHDVQRELEEDPSVDARDVAGRHRGGEQADRQALISR